MNKRVIIIAHMIAVGIILLIGVFAVAQHSQNSKRQPDGQNMNSAPGVNPGGNATANDTRRR